MWVLLLVLSRGVAILSVDNNAVCAHAVDCGYSGISRQECEGRGCCFENSAQQFWCSGPASCKQLGCSGHGTCANDACVCNKGWKGPTCYDPDVNVKVVHVVQSCHLDVGFADSAVGIINRYFDKHFPNIISRAAALAALGLGHKLQFMAHSYVVSLYLDCPLNMGIHCPSDADRTTFINAIKQGVIYWHAFPFNAEPELMSSLMVHAALQTTKLLDKQFGFESKRTMSQRDVPGMTSSIIEELLDNEVTAISVGVNGQSSFPIVPNAFRWRDTKGKEILAMWHPRGYGGYTRPVAVVVPGTDHALVTDWNTDNEGPYTVDEYVQHFKEIQEQFPGAQVISSTFDNFTQHILNSPAWDQLAVVDGEIGDTWIYGVPSDALKTAQTRAMDRAWTQYTKGDPATLRKLLEEDPVFANATRLMIKNYEHTWGKDVKSNLRDNAAWTNEDFTKARTSGPSANQYGILEESWREQKLWGIDIPLATLDAANHPLATLIHQQFDQILVKAAPSPTAEGYLRIDPSETTTCLSTKIGFNTKNGGLVLGSLGSVDRTIGVFDYRTYDQNDIKTYLENYLVDQPPPDWAFADFGKPNCTSQKVQFQASLLSTWRKVEGGKCSFLVNTQFATQAFAEFGAPRDIWTRYTFQDKGALAMEVIMIEKTPTRRPEAMFLHFNPITDNQSPLLLEKSGGLINADLVVKGGSKHLHGVEAVLFPLVDKSKLRVEYVDAAVTNIGTPFGYPTPTNVTAQWRGIGASANLFNNLWGTNYVMWQPYYLNGKPVSGEENFRFRFNIQFPTSA